MIATAGGHALAQPAEPFLLLDSQLRHLVRSYPAFLDRREGNALIWRDGTRMAIDDGMGPKQFARLLEAPDIKDLFFAAYPAGPDSPVPALNFDPGRARNRAFFDKMYGDCRSGTTQPNLTDVVWLPKKWGKPLKVTRINGVAEKLAEVSRALDALPAAFDRFLFPAAGTFNCRAIAGTSRPSAHGHGIAIDIAVAQADYWRWSKSGAGGQPVYRNRIPMEIVAIFEASGFIWGGKWHHYDTMHFEYRPELLGTPPEGK